MPEVPVPGDKGHLMVDAELSDQGIGQPGSETSRQDPRPCCGSPLPETGSNVDYRYGLDEFDEFRLQPGIAKDLGHNDWRQR